MVLFKKNGWIFFLVFFSAIVGAQSPENAGKTKFFLGEMTTFSPENIFLKNSISLTQYQIFPQANKVLLIKKVFHSNVLVQESVIVFTIQGSQFSFSESRQFFSGKGTLIGTPWNWTSGSYEYTLINGNRIQETISIQPGTLVFEKTLLNPQNQIEEKITERQQSISATLYTLLLNSFSASSSGTQESPEMSSYKGRPILFKTEEASIEVPVLWKYHYFLNELGEEIWHGKAECYDLRGNKISDGEFLEGRPWSGTIAKVILSCGYMGWITTFQNGEYKEEKNCDAYILEDALQLLQEKQK